MIDWSEIARFATAMGAAWSVAWFINRQNNSIKSLIYAKFDDLKNVFLDKLEYHERHDDTRFESIRKDMYQLGIRLAAKTGKLNGTSQEDHS